MTKDGLIAISRGPQFGEGESVFLYFFALAVLVLAIAFMINGNYLFMIASLPILVVCAIYILNIQGVEINVKKQLVRVYTLKVVGKTGEWKDLKSFHSISVDNETYHVRFKIPDNILDITEQHSHFVIKLINSSIGESITLAESTNYSAAQDFARKLATDLNLVYTDEFERRLSEAKLKKRRR